jgi:hypothetical protein
MLFLAGTCIGDTSSGRASSTISRQHSGEMACRGPNIEHHARKYSDRPMIALVMLSKQPSKQVPLGTTADADRWRTNFSGTKQQKQRRVVGSRVGKLRNSVLSDRTNTNTTNGIGHQASDLTCTGATVFYRPLRQSFTRADPSGRSAGSG